MEKQDLFTGIGVKPEHLMELANLFEGLGEDGVKDILPWVRENLAEYQDQLMDTDTQVDLFTNKIPAVQCICWSEDYKHPEIGCEVTPTIRDHEPDEVLFAINFKAPFNRGIWTVEDNLRDILLTIATFLLSDCTGCCNALNFINITKDGVIAGGRVAHTYHS